MPQFDILIVGAGLVGLATAIGLRKKGHSVRVVESTSSLQVIGDAIAVGSNQQRILEHYGILQDFYTRAVSDVGCMYYRSWSSGEIVSTRDMKTQKADYGYASCILSRAGYQDFLYQQAKKLGVEFLFGHRVESVEDDGTRPAVKLKDGSIVEADIIVGADGIKSKVRTAVSPKAHLTSQWDCYRATISRERLGNDPELRPYLQGIHFMMGPNLLIILSNMADVGDVSLNMYCLGDTGSAGSWSAPAASSSVREIFKGCSSAMQKMLTLVDKCIVWKVAQVSSLDSWSSSNGKIVLVGDACHAMTPHQGQVWNTFDVLNHKANLHQQGCSSGMEDSGVLSECISYAKTIEDIPSLLKTYESLRRPRVELIQGTSAFLGKLWSLPDGEQQQQRDENMRKIQPYYAGAWDGKPIETIPTGLRDPNYSPWLMAYDAVESARKELDARA